MSIWKALQGKPIATILAAVMMVSALACAGGADPTATSAPTATSPAPTATSPGADAGTGTTEATAVPVEAATAAPATWMERYMQGDGYLAEWGEPKSGGIFKYGASHDGYRFVPGTGHGYRGDEVLATQNALFRTNPWVGLGTMEGDLVDTWEMAADGLKLTMVLREGVKFQDNSHVPASYEGGKIGGDEFTCEDALASFYFQMVPSEEDTHYVKFPVYFANLKGYQGKASHIESGDPIPGLSCPDGPLGYTFQIEFDSSLAKTMPMLAAGRGTASIADKNWIDWYVKESPGNMYYGGSPENYVWLTGTGPFVATEYQPDIVTKIRRNPTYFREGLPLLDGIDFIVIKDFTTRFTSLVTGQTHFFGEGSSSLLPGQVEQVERDFADRVVIDPIMHSWGRAGVFNPEHLFADARARHAVHIALDRDEWIYFRKAGGYEGTQLAYLMPPGSYWAMSDEELREQPGYRQPKDEDIAEANRLMDEVWGPGERPNARCMASNVQNNIDGCLFVMDQLGKHLDMEVALEAMESAVYTQKQEAMNYDMIIGSWLYTEVVDPDDVFPIRFLEEYASTTEKLRIAPMKENIPALYKEIEDESKAIQVEMDKAKRLEMTRALELKLSQQVNKHLILGWTNIFPGWGNQVKGYNASNHYSQLKYAIWERVWLSE